MTTGDTTSGLTGPRATAETAPIMEARGLGKRYGGIVALEEVDIAFAPGEVHALVGENGAGKSTLGKILAGGVHPDAGEVLLDGEPVTFGSPRDALALGVATILQEISLVPGRTVLENVYLGHESSRAGVLRGRTMRERWATLAENFPLSVDPNARAGTLRLADQQKVEILRAVARGARVIVMDEPTAVLTPDEVAALMGVIRRLRDDGAAIVYVSHFLEEVLAISDKITVLRDGHLISTKRAADHDHDSLVNAMLGRSLSRVFPSLPEPGSMPVLEVEGLTRDGVLEDISFAVREGEIVGLAGLVGAGRSELARAVAGVDRRDAGEIRVRGAGVDVRSPAGGTRAGIAMIPESRKEEGLCLGLSVGQNTTMSHLREVSRAGVMTRRGEVAAVRRAIERFDIRSARPATIVEQLSGGNQQKVLFAKCLFRSPDVLIADEPTRGVDVGAKVAIYEILADLAAQGMGVLLISSEIEEILGLSHRVLVMRRGRLAGEFSRAEATEHAIMRAAFGTGYQGSTKETHDV